MKLRRLFFAFLLLLAAFQFCFSQEKPKAVLIDEFDKVTCDELSLRLDELFLALTTNEGSKGYIIISGYKNEPIKKYSFAEMIKGYANLTKLVNKRFVFIFNDAENARTQLWLVPTDSDVSTFAQKTENYELPQTFKPTLIYANSWDEFCAESFSNELYSKFLQTNSNVKGNLVIYEKSLKNFRKTEKTLLDELVKVYKIPPNQLKTFYVRKNISDVEFWLVPKKKK
jgi:hypothetical protein